MSVMSTPDVPRIMVTQTLPPQLAYKIPETVEEILATGGSAMGYSAISTYLSCPERSRLRSLGVKPKPKPSDGSGLPPELEDNALTWGSINHAIRAVRIVYGQDRALQLINELKLDKKTPLAESDKISLQNIWLTYEATWPLAQEPFKYLAVECEVFSDIGDGAGHPLIRSVRYDSLAYAFDAYGNPGLFSFECKTTSRAGANQYGAYSAQFYTQVAFWNANPELVRQYGPMRGVIVDGIIKTKVPKMERVEKPVGLKAQEIAIAYARLPEKVGYPVDAEGRFPRMLHTCWGRFSPCDMIGLCHEDARGDYLIHGEPLQ